MYSNEGTGQSGSGQVGQGSHVLHGAAVDEVVLAADRRPVAPCHRRVSVGGGR